MAMKKKKEEGRKEGRKEGRREGRKEGRKEGREREREIYLLVILELKGDTVFKLFMFNSPESLLKVFLSHLSLTKF